MLYISLDIETTGLIPEENQILEIGMIAVDTEKDPSTYDELHLIINHKKFVGDAYAISLNGRIFNIIQNYLDKKETQIEVIEAEELLHRILLFLGNNNYVLNNNESNYTVNIAGKNAANFDVPFLQHHFNNYNNCNYESISDTAVKVPIKFRKRTIDPSILYVDMINDSTLPSLSECKKRANLSKIVTHNAKEDAWDVVYLLLNKYNEKFANRITDDKLNKFVDQFNNLRPWSSYTIRSNKDGRFKVWETFSIYEKPNKKHTISIVRKECFTKDIPNKNIFNTYTKETAINGEVIKLEKIWSMLDI